MKQYRLKKEAVPFFKQELSTKIIDLETWKEYQVDENALEIVEDAIVYFGIETDKYNSFCGWINNKNKDGGSYFCFTIRFPSMKIEEYDKFSNGKFIRELMDKIQKNVSFFFNDYKNNL